MKRRDPFRDTEKHEPEPRVTMRYKRDLVMTGHPELADLRAFLREARLYGFDDDAEVSIVSPRDYGLGGAKPSITVHALHEATP